MQSNKLPRRGRWAARDATHPVSSWPRPSSKLDSHESKTFTNAHVFLRWRRGTSSSLEAHAMRPVQAGPILRACDWAHAGSLTLKRPKFSVHRLSARPVEAQPRLSLLCPTERPRTFHRYGTAECSRSTGTLLPLSLAHLHHSSSRY